MIMGSIQEDDTILINIYAPITRTPKYKKQILTNIKGEIDSKTIIVRDFATPFTSMNRSSRQKINKEILALNDMLDQMYLIDRYRILIQKLQNTHSLQVHIHEHSPK